MSFIQPVLLPEACMRTSGIQLEIDIYRGDLEHPKAPGNKWHKLNYHLKEAKKQNADVIATFGGPFSNHLHAFGSTLNALTMQAVAVVRGELHPSLTPTLRDMVLDGVELWPSSRADYRLGMDSWIVKEINRHYGHVYWIPEGGGGRLGALGCYDWAADILKLDKSYDAWVISSGTGTTAAGILSNPDVPDLHVFSALKGEPEQRQVILDLACELAGASLSKDFLEAKLFFHSDCHEGGYAKHSEQLITFIQEFALLNPQHPLDPVYTSKTMYAVLNAMKAGNWPYQRTLFIHSGGLQGWRGYSKATNPYGVL